MTEPTGAPAPTIDTIAQEVTDLQATVAAVQAAQAAGTPATPPPAAAPGLSDVQVTIDADGKVHLALDGTEVFVQA